jgi:nucleoside-diphosphate-sugar epimerase
MTTSTPLAELPRIETLDALEEALSRPTPAVVGLMGRLDGDIMLLGACGKVGPSLAHMTRRACDEAGVRRRVIAVGRSISDDLLARFDRWGVEFQRCDLLDRHQLAALPDARNLIYLAGMKFGSSGRASLTWALNTYLPGLVCERFPDSRIAAYSTGNVYPLMPSDSGGADEQTPPAPLGEYAMSCLGRERMFEHFSQTLDIPVATLRLNYAHDLRYGVMVDLARKIADAKPIDLSMGYFNAIWQGDSNAMTLMALEHTAVPARPINLAGPETLSVRLIAEQLAEQLGQPLELIGEEARDALLSNGALGHELLGRPTVPPETMIRWIAHWIEQGGPLLGKPTKFEVRNGKF